MDYRQHANNQQLQPQTTQTPQQRFSWQPVPDEEAPAYEQVQHQQAPQRTPQHAPEQPHVSSNTDSQIRHFSYAQTPIEHEAFFYVASPTAPPLPQNSQAPQSPAHQMQSPYTPIDPRPQSMFNPLTAAQPQPQTAYVPPASHPQDVKHPISPISPHESPRTLPFSPISPVPSPQAYPQLVQAPQRPSVIIPQSNHARKMSGLSPINTNIRNVPMPLIPATPPSAYPTSPLPQKTPMTPISPGIIAKQDVSRNNRTSYANEPYSPHGFTSNQTNNLHAVFSPDAAHGPNGLDFALHQPGQTKHPNMGIEQSPEWNHSLCSCGPDVSTCLTGLICPCMIYGRTSYRLSQRSAKKDPTDMLGYSATNGHCMMMGISCGLWWLFPMLQRTRIRHAYKLAGGLGSDLLKGCCCCCCVAVQNEREVKSREEASRRWAGPASTDVYTRPGGMVYAPQH